MPAISLFVVAEVGQILRRRMVIRNRQLRALGVAVGCAVGHVGDVELENGPLAAILKLRIEKLIAEAGHHQQCRASMHGIERDDGLPSGSPAAASSMAANSRFAGRGCLKVSRKALAAGFIAAGFVAAGFVAAGFIAAGFVRENVT